MQHVDDLLNTVTTTHAEASKENMLSEMEHTVNALFNKALERSLTKNIFYPVRPPNFCHADHQLVCFYTGSYFSFCSCNLCLWFVAFMKGFNMFTVIYFKWQMCMVGALTLTYGATTLVLIKA